MTSHDQAALPPLTEARVPKLVGVDHRDWLARLAHDLRSPLVAIGYASQMLRSGRAPPQKTDELFATIDRQTAQLARLAEEIGDMLLIGGDRFAVRHGHCDLVAVVREALHESAPGQTPAAAFAGGNAHAVGVSCDRARLVQLLRHVIRLTGKRRAGAALPAIEVGVDASQAYFRIEDATGIYRSDALLFLAHGAAPQDPGVLCMSDIIMRRVLEAHGGTLAPGEFADDRTTSLTLTLPAT
ncbi:MAG: histidine kinase dimerization/phospho-acceptor domain-containing protein [Lysobacterales bacterium]